MLIPEQPTIHRLISLETGYSVEALCLVDGIPARIEITVDTGRPKVSAFSVGLWSTSQRCWGGSVVYLSSAQVGRMPMLHDTDNALVANAPSAKTGIILNLGDFFHSDNDSNRTPKSGHALDVDGRYAKILRVGVDLLIHCIQLALQRHEKVVVRCLPGNHDPYASLALATALGAFFSKSPRVTVDADPSPFFKYRFDKVLIASAHGDMIKAADMPGFVAATWPEDWGATRFRYVYLGHVHHRSVGGGEKAGVVWETFQTLAPKDIWHHSSGYVSGRSMVSITHHRAKGEVKRSTVSVKE